jgi:sugar/nucleoside kinase (ribokinase family)
MTDSAPRIDVLTVGHALVDVLATTTDQFLADNGVIKGAMQLIDDPRAVELYSRMGPASETSGGSAANTAAGVVACGGTSAYVGTIANDELGEVFAHDIRAAGVEYQTPPVDGSVQTGRSFILVTPDGERSMNTNIAVSAKVSAQHIDMSMLQRARITYIEGYLFDDSHPIEQWNAVMEVIRKAGNQFAITLSDPFCVERHRKLFLDLLDGHVDICFGNEEEVCSLFETTSLDEALSLLSSRCEVGAITRGAAGSVLVCGNSRVEIPAEPADVVDTTGAGDLYASGVLYGIARDWDLDKCGRMGSLAAAAIISRMGARPPAEIPFT